MRTFAASLAAVLFAGPVLASAPHPASQDSTGLPGDHFDLQGAVELFKAAKDLEGFERSLNTEDQRVNNLDLDANGQVDYVRVIDHAEGDAHAIALQIALGKDEFQDVAVIELEKNGSESAVLQIRGAEELYGADVIVEPFEETEEAPMQKGPAPPVDGPRFRIWVNVWGWPCVSWLYGPSYIAWNSPWYWGYYPPWWRPWSPWGWSAWYGWNRPYWGWYQYANNCRVTQAHAIYQHRAVRSAAVRERTQATRTARAATPQQDVRRQAPPVRNGQRATRPERVAPQQRQRPQPTRTAPGGRSGGQRGKAPVQRGR